MGKLITTPFAALLRLMYSISGSYGLSIILFSLIVTLIMVPFQMKSKRSMVRMGKLTDKQAELQKQYAKNQQKYQEELAKLYQEEGINPMGGCLWSFLPMFIIIPLYSIIRQPIVYFMGLSTEVCDALRNVAMTLGYVPQTIGNGGSYNAYEQVYLSDFITRNWDKYDWQGIEGAGSKLLQMRFDFLGINLGRQPSDALSNFTWDLATIGLILVPIVAAVLSYVQTIVINKSNGQTQQQASMKMMNLILPLSSIWICFSMPAGLGLYWIANSVWGMIRESTLGRYYTKKINAEEEERAAKRAAARQLRMEEAKKRAAEQQFEPKKPKKQPQKSPEKKVSTTEAGRVAERPYARGRSYQADRYDEKE